MSNLNQTSTEKSLAVIIDRLDEMTVLMYKILRGEHRENTPPCSRRTHLVREVERIDTVSEYTKDAICAAFLLWPPVIDVNALTYTDWLKRVAVEPRIAKIVPGVDNDAAIKIQEYAKRRIME